eukprot:6473379-Alexandrium_andersonii.AAC.1
MRAGFTVHHEDYVRDLSGTQLTSEQRNNPKGLLDAKGMTELRSQHSAAMYAVANTRLEAASRLSSGQMHDSRNEHLLQVNKIIKSLKKDIDKG